MTLITRHVQRGWLFPRTVLQVEDGHKYGEINGTYQRISMWRDATPADLDRIEEEKLAIARRFAAGPKFKRGQRVKGTRSGFNKGFLATVEFQEPCGRVWVTRDRTDGPIWCFPDELDHWYDQKKAA